MSVGSRRVVLGIIILLSMMGLASALDCTSTNVCGYSTSVAGSTSGYGAVELCGECYACGIADGYCPEDFYSEANGLQGSCGKCADPDCTAYIDGYVQVEKNGQMYYVDAAKIWAKYRMGTNYETEYLTKTDENGFFHINNTLRSGYKVTLWVTYIDQFTGLNYLSEEINATIIRGEEYHWPNYIPIEEAECNADCTRGTVNSCDPTCHGLEGCTFKATTAYPPPTLMDEADGKEVGIRINLDTRVGPISTDEDYFMTCNGAVQTETRYTITGGGGGSEFIEHLISRSTRVLYNGEAVDLVVSYWG